MRQIIAFYVGEPACLHLTWSFFVGMIDNSCGEAGGSRITCDRARAVGGKYNVN